MNGIRASPGQLAALGALAEHGSLKAAAHALGITPTALEHRLRKARERNEGRTTLQLVYRLGQERTDRRQERTEMGRNQQVIAANAGRNRAIATGVIGRTRIVRRPTIEQIAEWLGGTDPGWLEANGPIPLTLVCPCGPTTVRVDARDTPATILAAVVASRARRLPRCAHVDR